MMLGIAVHPASIITRVHFASFCRSCEARSVAAAGLAVVVIGTSDDHSASRARGSQEEGGRSQRLGATGSVFILSVLGAASRCSTSGDTRAPGPRAPVSRRGDRLISPHGPKSLCALRA